MIYRIRVLIRHLPDTSIARGAALLAAACLLFALTAFAPGKGIAAGAADLHGRSVVQPTKASAASADSVARAASAGHGQGR